MALVITSCTNRKRKPVPPYLRMSALPRASLATLAADWGERLARESARIPAFELYGGRAFQESTSAARALDARMVVVSAGLGLIDAQTEVPPYSCTVLLDSPDSVPTRLSDAASASDWWSALRESSPFAQPLASWVVNEPGAILAALSDAYLDLLREELIALPASALARVRIFTRAPMHRIASALQPLVMPYDDRLDGPDSSIRGTRSDFAARALQHYVGLGLPSNRSAANDANVVTASIATWRMPDRFDRMRHDDDTLLGILREQWDMAGGSSTRLLRVFRDDLSIACEQSRFAALARQVREERA